jgi:hypothetical protein
VWGQNSSLEPSSTAKRNGPTIAIGGGTLSYFGEVSQQKGVNSPLTSRLAFNLALRQNINYFLEYELIGWRGVISANERSLDRNLNFESTMYGFGLNVNYNFSNFLKKEHIVEPLIGVGFQVISFSSKTDLYDENGIAYNYWSDGTIRNVPENSGNDAQSVIIQRDYFYESDIKTSDMYGFDEYPTYMLSIPVTVGANMIITDKWTFRAALTYHFTMGDLADGVAYNSGNYKGDEKSDNLLYTNFSLAHNLTSDKPRKDAMDKDIDTTPFPLDEDEDKDGVNDFVDDCLGTPEGVAVNEKGCPLDGDNDLVSDYKDDEKFSAPEAVVDSTGVTITDEVRDLYYKRYYDVTGNYSPIDKETNTMQVIANKVTRRGEVSNKSYAVSIGEFTGDIPLDLVSQILTLSDVNTYESGDKIIVAVGKYNSSSAAISRQRELERNGTKTTGIIVVDQNFRVTKFREGEGTSGSKGKGSMVPLVSSNSENKVVYRIQIGAFSRTPDEKQFAGLPNLVKVNSNDGLIRYYSGYYTDQNEAAKAKIDIMVNYGIKGVFIVAFKGGNTIPINNLDPGKRRTVAPAPFGKLDASEKQNVHFRVQLGSFSKEIPTNVLESYMQLNDVQQFKGSDGYIRYTAGEFSTYEEALAHQKTLRSKGYNGCFVVGEYKETIISSAQAKDLLSE